MNDKDSAIKIARKTIGEMFQSEAAMYEKHGCQLDFRFRSSKKGNPYLVVSVQLASDSKSTAISKHRIKVFIFDARQLLKDLTQSNLHTPSVQIIEKCLNKDLKYLLKSSPKNCFKNRYNFLFSHLVTFCRFYSAYKEYYRFDNTIFVVIVLVVFAVIGIIISSYCRIKLDNMF